MKKRNVSNYSNDGKLQTFFAWDKLFKDNRKINFSIIHKKGLILLIIADDFDLNILKMHDEYLMKYFCIRIKRNNIGYNGLLEILIFFTSKM